MTTERRSNKKRVYLRLDAGSKRKLEKAAAYAETTMSQFVLRNAIEAAEHTIEVHEKTVLQQEDWVAFNDALVNPPEPNDALKRAVKRYRKQFDK